MTQKNLLHDVQLSGWEQFRVDPIDTATDRLLKSNLGKSRLNITYPKL